MKLICWQRLWQGWSRALCNWTQITVIVAIAVSPRVAMALEGTIDYGPEDTTTSTATTVSTGGSALQLFVGLMVVFALIAACAFIARAWQRGGMRRFGGQRHLNLVETLQVAPKRSVAVVTIAGRALVIGCGEHDISLLREFPIQELEPAADSEIPVPAVAASPSADSRDASTFLDGDESSEADRGSQSQVSTEIAIPQGPQRVSEFKRRLQRTLSGSGDEA